MGEDKKDMLDCHYGMGSADRYLGITPITFLSLIWNQKKFLALKIKFFSVPDQTQECNCNPNLFCFNRIQNFIYMCVYFYLFYPYSDLAVHFLLYIGIFFESESNHVWIVVASFQINLTP